MDLIRRRIATLAIAAATLAPLGLLATAVAPAALAADSDGLDLRTTSSYVLIPDRGVVRVTVDITVTNQTPSVTRGNVVTSYYFDTIVIPVQDEAARLRVAEGSRRLRATQGEREGYDQVTISLSNRLQYRQTDRIAVTYDLPGGKPRSASDIRVGKAFATFYAWAVGDRGNVRVEIPKGFEVDTYGDQVRETRSNGKTILTASVDQTANWYVGVYAANEANLTDSRLDLEGGEAVVVKAWPEDGVWSDRVGGLLTDALPALEDLLGLPWPVVGDLEVSEVHTPLLEGYAGIYDTSTDAIVITEDLDDLVIVHEASHAWFNKGLFAERWASEGMADLYADLTLQKLGEGRDGAPAVSSTSPDAFKLVDWPAPEAIDDDETDARERFGYDASWSLMERLHREIGDDGMRRVIQAAEARTNPYLGSGDPEEIGGFVDWRRLLDLFQEVGGSEIAEGQFHEWVASGAVIDLELRQRTEARAAFAGLAEARPDWAVPKGVRRAMADWDFDIAERRIIAANQLLATVTTIQTEAAAAGLTVPMGVQDLYEDAVTSFADASALADSQLAALRAVVAAASTVSAPRETFTQMGLWDVEQPELQLAAARSAWSAGDLQAATGAASAAQATLALAPEAGRQKALLIGGGVAAGVLVVLIGAFLLIRRRRRRRVSRLALVAAAEAALTASASGPSTELMPPPAGLVPDEPTATALPGPIDPDGSAI
jgi:hypothetical protein